MKKPIPKPMLVITGPTATGKTRLAARLAHTLDGEVIGADSRQVYKEMDLGSGKDVDDYLVDGRLVPYHLIDLVEPGYQYNVYEYQRDFLITYQHVTSRGKWPILCGGSGLYVEAATGGVAFQEVPEDSVYRKSLEGLTMEELVIMLAKLKPLHNTTDTNDRLRLIRALEIARFEAGKDSKRDDFPNIPHLLFAIRLDRTTIRQRITQRLKHRLGEGMVAEVEKLLKGGIKPSQLAYYGLEYRYLTLYVTGEISYAEMFSKLNTAIHQFAKRQMTWFRRMEKNGRHIHWVDGSMPLDEQISWILEKIPGSLGGEQGIV